MKFQPKSEDEVNDFDLLKDGVYDFEVIKARDEISGAGNEMIALELDVFNMEGRKYRVFDYLVNILDYKIRHFCHAVGLVKEYETGSLTSYDCLSRGGRCIITTKKDASGQYRDKNVIRDYVPMESMENKSSTNPEDIPF